MHHHFGKSDDMDGNHFNMGCHVLPRPRRQSANATGKRPKPNPRYWLSEQTTRHHFFHFVNTPIAHLYTLFANISNQQC